MLSTTIMVYVEPGTEPHPSMAFLAVVGKNSNEKGHRWALFRTRLSLFFLFFLHIMFTPAKSKERERENL